jgi:hypothetical protein
MAASYRWETRQVTCPEEGCPATLLVQWHDTETVSLLNGIHCDHPRLRDLDNWECRWSCWQEIADQGTPQIDRERL